MKCGLFPAWPVSLIKTKLLPKASSTQPSAFMFCIGLPCQSPGKVTSITHQGEKDPSSFILTLSLLPRESMMANGDGSMGIYTLSFSRKRGNQKYRQAVGYFHA